MYDLTGRAGGLFPRPAAERLPKYVRREPGME